MSVRLLHLTLISVFGQLVLLGGGQLSRGIEIMGLRHEVAMLKHQACRPAEAGLGRSGDPGGLRAPNAMK
ncbi:hypothetical protein ACIBG7_26600 [Nonomuraea sp. NPDC050328]|uniref:hypothetical protein n=1 Tax=Nonomuraea sp. NPDC050328 TaxID=3364361 RepID=UPI0037A67DEF